MKYFLLFLTLPACLLASKGENAHIENQPGYQPLASSFSNLPTEAQINSFLNALPRNTRTQIAPRILPSHESPNDQDTTAENNAQEQDSQASTNE